MTGAATMVKIDIQYVYEDVDRHGNVRVYFWRGKGQRKVRFKDPVGSTAFVERYKELMAEVDAGAHAAAPTGDRRGTWRWLCERYLASDTFRNIATSTQGARRSCLEATYDEPVQPGSTETYGDYPVDRMTPKAIRVLRDRKKNAALPEAANYRLKSINAVFKWALSEENDGRVDGYLIASNPARDVTRYKSSSGGWHTWEPHEVEKFEARHPIGSKARLALALLMYTGGRRSDVSRLGKQHRRMVANPDTGRLEPWFKWRVWKNRERKHVEIEIPILTELEQILEQSPVGDLTYIVTEFGKPFTNWGFGNKMRQWCDQAGLPHCSAHGLRKAGATRAAENGATVHQLMAIFGWATTKEAETYTRAARRKKLAAAGIHTLARRSKT